MIRTEFCSGRDPGFQNREHAIISGDTGHHDETPTDCAKD
jgi:hypothetical protein